MDIVKILISFLIHFIKKSISSFQIKLEISVSTHCSFHLYFSAYSVTSESHQSCQNIHSLQQANITASMDKAIVFDKNYSNPQYAALFGGNKAFCVTPKNDFHIQVSQVSLKRLTFFVVTLRELIFAGINFRFFGGFSAKSRKFEPAKYNFIQKFEKPLGKWKKFVQKKGKTAKINSCEMRFFRIFFRPRKFVPF